MADETPETLTLDELDYQLLTALQLAPRADWQRIGAMYPLSENGGITGELKGVFLFPSSGMSVSLQAGYTHGF